MIITLTQKTTLLSQEIIQTLLHLTIMTHLLSALSYLYLAVVLLVDVLLQDSYSLGTFSAVNCANSLSPEQKLVQLG